MPKFTSRRSVAVAACVGVVVIGTVVGGAYALVGVGNNYAVGEQPKAGKQTVVTAEATGTVVSRVQNTAFLDPEIKVITVPLGVKFKVPGQLYGTRAKQPIQLGPPGVEGMTQDCFGSRMAITFDDGKKLLYPFLQHLRDFPDEAPGSEHVPNGTPIDTSTIRLLDLTTGEDSLLLSGARSMALRADGKFAYAKGVEENYRYNFPYLQRIMVQDGLSGSPECWTTDSGIYSVLQWAKGALFVERQYEGEATEVVALTGPDQMKLIVGQDERLLAVSPDGSQIAVASGICDPSGETCLRIVRWETGAEVCRLRMDQVLDPASGEKVQLGRRGSWEGSTLIVGLTPTGAALLSTEADKLELKDVIALRYPKLRLGTDPEPLLNADATKIFLVTDEATGQAELERTAVITYDLASGECARWIVPDRAAITNLVFDPSRPR